jgi:acyl-CoA thioester hydrolase
MAERASLTCGLAVVHPWLCDAMGHLTTRHYLGMFDDASYHLFAALGYDPVAGKRDHQGWADVSHQIDYRSELAAGALVRIEGEVTALGRTSITSEFRMIALDSERLCATLAARTVCFDLKQRRSRPLPAQIVARARELFGAIQIVA